MGDWNIGLSYCKLQTTNCEMQTYDIASTLFVFSSSPHFAMFVPFVMDIDNRQPTPEIFYKDKNDFDFDSR